MSTKKLIVYLGALDGFKEVKRVAQSKFCVQHSNSTEIDLAHNLKNCHGLVDASMQVFISNEIIANADKLEIISTATTGSDHIARKELERRGIVIRTLREDAQLLKNITPAAEMSWALLMALARNLIPAVNHVRKGYWQREEFPGVMLRGRRLGIIGCGRIGQWVASYARAFGMEVWGYDPNVSPWPRDIKKVELDELGRGSDFVSVHVHLSDFTVNLLDRKFLENMKVGSILINTSRGAIVDEEALLHGLQAGVIGGYGADVLVGEPHIQSHPLIQYSKQHDNVIVTPHCGGYSPDAIRLVCNRATQKIVDYFSSKNI